TWPAGPIAIVPPPAYAVAATSTVATAAPAPRRTFLDIAPPEVVRGDTPVTADRFPESRGGAEIAAKRAQAAVHSLGGGLYMFLTAANNGCGRRRRLRSCRRGIPREGGRRGRQRCDIRSLWAVSCRRPARRGEGAEGQAAPRSGSGPA